jgi:predicted transposase/invertase (TIGR01784 family)
MSGSWDNALKFLVQEKPQDFVSWLMGKGQWEKEVLGQLKARHINTDVLYQVQVNKHPCLLHIEFQRRGDPNMARRMWEYNVLATQQFSLPVYSFVIYLISESGLAFSPFVLLDLEGEAIHTFRFGVIKLWEIPTEQLKSLGFKGLLPLLLLTKGGQERAVVEEITTALSGEKSKENRELLVLTYSIATLIFVESEDKTWLRRRFGMLDDMLADSWLFKELIEKGEQKGFEEGLKQSLDLSRQTAITLVERLHPSLVSLAKTKVENISDPNELQQLILQISLAKGETEVRAALEK